jgi:hypothetical protein
MERRTRDKHKGAIIVGNIAEVVKNKAVLRNTPFKISPKGGFYMVGEELVPSLEFEARYPTQLLPLSHFRGKGDNPDKTKNWRHDNKSY